MEPSRILASDVVPESTSTTRDLGTPASPPNGSSNPSPDLGTPASPPMKQTPVLKTVEIEPRPPIKP